ncbi:response regulator [Reyranella sp.]|uniref:response regulator n=1 Tax=Reyranella sp. TaxID=1929291 RepID=UPI003783BE19
MVVEADAAVRESLKFALEIEGFKVRTYETPNQLLAENDLPRAGVLIAHYHLPSMNGLDLILEMRRRSSIPALLVTGGASGAIRKRASDAGVSLVVKPFLGAVLIDRIRKLLDSAHKG